MVFLVFAVQPNLRIICNRRNEEGSLSHGIYYRELLSGLSIAFAIHSVDRSLFTRLILAQWVGTNPYEESCVGAALFIVSLR